MGQEPPQVAARSQADLEECAALGRHQHPRHLLGWLESGVVTVRTASQDWLVPPTRGLWIPADTSYALEAVRPGRVSVVFFDPAQCPISWAEPTGVRLTPLVRELITYLIQNSYRDQTREQLESVLLALLEPVSATVFQVPLPADPRARVIADGLIANPADGRDLPTWARHANAGVRTITRLFVNETGMSFVQWRTHVRVRAAIAHLERGTPVSVTARAVGYRKAAAFSEVFQRITGKSFSNYPDDIRG